jgi:hypothetical protein
MWTRVVDFWAWGLDQKLLEGVNVYEKFREQNARLFKHTYQPRFPEVSFQEAAARVARLSDDGARALGIHILGSGARFHEAIQGRDDVIGKGSKPRHLYRPATEKEVGPISYARFRRALQAVGLKPHDLRKLCAARLAEIGLKEQDLLKVMGWTSMETAKFYLSPKKDAELKKIFEGIHKELK